MSYRVINGKVYETQNFIPSQHVFAKSKEASKTTFQQVLEGQKSKENTFTISSHAAQRLKDRNIIFNEVDMNKINEGINLAGEKGAKDSLILYKDVALITSIKNRTIITAVEKGNGNENVFTNIDSVVLL